MRGHWKCIEAAGEEGFIQPRCVEVINRPGISASCSVAFLQKKPPDSAQSNAQVPRKVPDLRTGFEFLAVKRRLGIESNLNTVPNSLQDDCAHRDSVMQIWFDGERVM